MNSSANKTELIHANSAVVGNAGVLIIGASGTGKSTLALELMAFGADLIADDQTELSVRDNVLIANCPNQIQGRIEARGIGVIPADFRKDVKVCLVVDLDQTEIQRLPEQQFATILGCKIRLVRPPQGVHLAPAILQFLKGQRIA